MAAERETRADELNEGEAAFVTPSSNATLGGLAGTSAPTGGYMSGYASTDEATGKATLPPNPAASGQYAPGTKSPEEIEEDIRRTRAEMSETIDALTQRLNPTYVKEQVKETVKETVRSTTHEAGETFRTAGISMLDTIRENPLPAAIAALSIGYLFTRPRKAEARDYGGYAYNRQPDYRARGDYGTATYGGYEREGYGSRYGAYGADYQTDADYAYGSTGADDGGASLKDRAGDVAHRAQDAAGAARDRMGRLGHQAGDQAQHLAEQAQQAGRRASNWLERSFRENPLALGAVAVAAGALVGLSVPETEGERRMFGPTSDRLKDQAKDMVEEKVEGAKQVASAVADEVKAKAQDVLDTVKEEAKNVAQTAKDEAGRQGLMDAPQGETSGDDGDTGFTPYDADRFSGGSTGGSQTGGSSMGGSTGGSTSGGSAQGGRGSAL